MPRLLDHLKSLGHTSGEARDLLGAGKVFVRGVPTADDGREVDRVEVEVRPAAPRIQPGRDLAVLHKDPELAVVWKPSGLLAVPAANKRNEASVIGIVRRLFGSAFAVHRIDQPTSGVMVVALTERCQQALKELFFHHEIERRYLALVTGWFPKTPMTVRSRILRDRGDGLRGSIEALDEEEEARGADEGREAVTHLELVETLSPRSSLVRATLETGRTHQVRIHLAEKKHAILGDELYAPTGVTRAAKRLALHAAELDFKHPFTGETLCFDAPLADDLERLCRRLRRSVGERKPGQERRKKPKKYKRR